MAGNIAVHDAETYEDDKIRNVHNFIDVMGFFNNLLKEN